MAKLGDLVGKTLKDVQQVEDEEIIFVTECGKKYKLYHEQDCCECVTIESVVGDLSDLVGSPILLAEEATNSDEPAKGDLDPDDTYTWTFYKFATIKGYVDIRWFGSSNGYYSEDVNFVEVE